MNKNTADLKAAFEAAEKEHRAAFRRATWLERRLFSALTEAEYNAIAAELDAQEERLKDLGTNVTRARLAYTAAAIADRDADR